MKTFRTFGCIVAVIFMSANFLACKEEDKDEKSGLKPTSLGIAQIKSCTCTNRLDSIETYIFCYDSNGRVNGIVSEQVAFSDNPLTFSVDRDSHEDHVVGRVYDIELNEAGCATSMKYESAIYPYYFNEEEPHVDNCFYTLQYDSDNHLVAVSEIIEDQNNCRLFKDELALIWENDDLIRIESTLEETGDDGEIQISTTTVEMEYGEAVNNGVFSDKQFPFPVYFSQFGLIGRSTKHLADYVAVCTVRNNRRYIDLCTLAYEFDEKGRVTKITSTTNEANNSTPIVEIQTYTY